MRVGSVANAGQESSFVGLGSRGQQIIILRVDNVFTVRLLAVASEGDQSERVSLRATSYYVSW